ncbi:MAG: iron dicitrate transport regulator FecR [Planctomycetota bacterium]
MNPKSQVHLYILGQLDEPSVAKLNEQMGSDPELRRDFIRAVQVDAALRERSLHRAMEHVQGEGGMPGVANTNKRWPWRFIASSLAVAASVIAVIGFWSGGPNAVATIQSSENAAWESPLPTMPGAELTPGELQLKTGLATIRFRSGAELLLEAPASLELIDPMRGRLNSGAAMLQVPDSAKGFVLETPNGFAIDYGTRFAVRVDDAPGLTDIELLEGEIEVHHDATGDSKRLTRSGSTATYSSSTIQFSQAVPEEDYTNSVARSGDKTIRIGTNGRCRSVVAFEKFQDRRIGPSLLYVKKGNAPNWDYRSFFEFDVSDLDIRQFQTARLRLNLVPSDIGMAARLPRINRFAVYGLTNASKTHWKSDVLWSQSPGPDDGVLLGRFEIERSQQRGVFGIEGPALLSFILDHGDAPVTLIVVRETTKNDEGIGTGLVHAFASDDHPEAVGPMLELISK